MNDEFWKLAATGLLDGGVGTGSLLELLTAIADRDKRRTLINSGALDGHFVWLTYFNAAFGYVIDRATTTECWWYIADRFYNPHIRTDIPAKPQNVSESGGTITADAPASGYTLNVYTWDFVTFTELGTLEAHSAPGSGAYVLATHSDGDDVVSLPSGFVTVA